MKGEQPMLSAHYSFFHLGKQAVRFLCLTEQKAVETHPFGTSQCRSFHVVCTFDNGDVEFLHPSVSATVLKGESIMASGCRSIIFSISGFIPFPTSAMLPVRQPSCTSCSLIYFKSQTPPILFNAPIWLSNPQCTDE